MSLETYCATVPAILEELSIADADRETWTKWLAWVAAQGLEPDESEEAPIICRTMPKALREFMVAHTGLIRRHRDAIGEARALKLLRLGSNVWHAWEEFLERAAVAMARVVDVTE